MLLSFSMLIYFQLKSEILSLGFKFKIIVVVFALTNER